MRLSAGVRWTKETKDYFRTTSTFSSSPLLNSVAPFDFAPPKGKWSDVSPMASLDWQATPTTMLYARVAKGFQSGGFNGRANDPKTATKYDPEKVWSYEAGFKTTILNQLRVNGDVFYNNYRDFQARVSGIATDPTTGLPDPVLSVLNAGKLSIKGAELEASWTPLDGLLLDTQIGYLDAKYKEFDDAQFRNFGGSRAFQTPAFSPKWTLRAGAQYSFGLGSMGRNHDRRPDALPFAPGARRRQHLRELQTPNSGSLPERLLARGCADCLGESVEEVRGWLYGYNLTNKLYRTDAQEFSSIGNIRTVYFGAPRTVSLKLTARY